MRTRQMRQSDPLSETEYASSFPSGPGTSSATAVVRSEVSWFGSMSTRGVPLEPLGNVENALILLAVVAQDRNSDRRRAVGTL